MLFYNDKCYRELPIMQQTSIGAKIPIEPESVAYNKTSELWWEENFPTSNEHTISPIWKVASISN